LSVTLKIELFLIQGTSRVPFKIQISRLANTFKLYGKLAVLEMTEAVVDQGDVKTKTNFHLIRY